VSREPHASDSSPKNIGVFVARTADLTTIWQQELERKDVRSESAVDVMILAVDIGSHRTTQSHELRAWDNRREPAPRQKDFDDFS
jgi:hypothetical protein